MTTSSGVTETAWRKCAMLGEVWGAGWVADTHPCAVHAHAPDALSLHQITGGRCSVVDLHTVVVVGIFLYRG